MHQPRQDQFLLLPNFFHITFEAFVRIESSQFSKTMIFRFSPKSPQSHKTKPKHQSHELGYAPTMSRSIPFAPKLLPHHFLGICEYCVQPVLQKNDFRFSPHKPPSHKMKPKNQTWLSPNPTNINFGCICGSFSSLVMKHLHV